jgi:hypothetical protein
LKHPAIFKSILAIFLVSSFLIACDVVEMKYENVAEVNADGAIERGWIPSWIPKTAFNIKELHKIDTNQSQLALSFKLSEDWKVPEPCKSIAPSQLKPARYDRDWWPNDMLSDNKFVEEFNFYQCEKASQNLAVNFISRKVFHWRP